MPQFSIDIAQLQTLEPEGEAAGLVGCDRTCSRTCAQFTCLEVTCGARSCSASCPGTCNITFQTP